ncbi:MAG: LD-carboxypeptidase [Chitinophagaceae bacterium]|nr:LD-carboxypeptidase [Oligoflexus sp.]
MLQKSKTHIRIISPAGRFDSNLLLSRIAELEKEFHVSYHKLESDPSWPFTAGTIEARVTQLKDALLAPDIDVILCARGGYGVSDLLPHLPWKELKFVKPKLLIGFSDISALHSALYCQLDWPCVHGPMPGTGLWQKNDPCDIEALIAVMKGSSQPISIRINCLNQALPLPSDGWSYGGCLSVLTNLLGTSYFPKTLFGSILFWEDVGEHPGRILRFINQWTQSRALSGVKGIVLGRFADCVVPDICDEAMLKNEIAKRFTIPVWSSELFGHCAPNWPLPVGLPIQIDNGTLRWNLPPRTQ